MIWLDSIADSMDYPGDSEGQGSLTCLRSMGLQRVGEELETEQQLHPSDAPSPGPPVVCFLFPWFSGRFIKRELNDVCFETATILRNVLEVYVSGTLGET